MKSIMRRTMLHRLQFRILSILVLKLQFPLTHMHINFFFSFFIGCSVDEIFCDQTCYPKSILCNGISECFNEIDEEHCPPKRGTTTTRITATTRAPITFFGSDTHDAKSHYSLGTTYPPSCPEFTCPNGECFSSSDRCNGKWECNDGYDENECPSNKFFP